MMSIGIPTRSLRTTFLEAMVDFLALFRRTISIECAVPLAVSESDICRLIPISYVTRQVQVAVIVTTCTTKMSSSMVKSSVSFSVTTWTKACLLERTYKQPDLPSMNADLLEAKLARVCGIVF